MGLFDRWRKRPDPPASAPTPAEGEEGKVVPEGHKVEIHHLGLMPEVARSSAGAWLAHLGLSSDEQEEDVDRVLGEVEALVGGPRPQLLLAAVGESLSSLMAPEDPALLRRSGQLVWTLDAAALAGTPRAPALLQRLLEQMYLVSRAAITQTVFVTGHRSAEGRAVVTLIRELGIEVREPDRSGNAVLVEVHRPEGLIITALLGAPIEVEPPVSSWAREVNEAKERAADDGERRARLGDDERRALEARLAPHGGERRIAGVDRAPRLRRFLLAAAGEGGAPARKALYEELLGREIPLLLMVDPATRGIGLRSWPGGFEALAAYSDNASILTSARELGIPRSSLMIADMKPAALFEWAASNGRAVALCVFADSGKPLYVPIFANDVRALASGRPVPPDS